MATINYTIDDCFLKDAKYSVYFKSVLDDFTDKFGSAETISVSIGEEINPLKHTPQKDRIKFSEDRKNITIDFKVTRYFDKNGKLEKEPKPDKVMSSLKSLLSKAAELFNEKFD